MKIVYLNGNFISADEAKVPIADRSFLYGDGLFETARVYKGKVFRWTAHWERLMRGAGLLRIGLPLNGEAAGRAVQELLRRNGATEAILRIHLSRGIGPRGYSTRGAESPSLIMTLHPTPAEQGMVQWKLATSIYRVLAGDPLAEVKSASKLLQIMARMDAEQRGFDEALLLNSDGHIAEASSGNFFFVKGGGVFTPALEVGMLPGITRSVVMEICREKGIEIVEGRYTLADLNQANAAFITLSSFGLIEVTAIDQHAFPGSDLTKKILQSYRELVALEL